MSLISELFSDIFAQQDNCLTRVDPRTKLVVALVTLLCLMFSRNPAFPLLIVVLAVTSALAVKVPFRLVVLRLSAPLGVAFIVLVLQAVMTGSTPIASLQLLGHKITITQEGWQSGRLIASRVLGSVSVLLLLGMVTPAHRLFHASRWLGMPKAWLEIAFLMYRYIFILLDLVADMMVAQRVRLGYSSIRKAWTSAGTVGGTVIVRSMDQAVRTHEAMLVRGYHGELPFEAVPALSRRQWWTMSVAGSVVLIAFGLAQMRLK
jgi:cobalt/nickel transport system permease protein